MNYFCKEALSWMFDWVLNTPLYQLLLHISYLVKYSQDEHSTALIHRNHSKVESIWLADQGMYLSERNKLNHLVGQLWHNLNKNAIINQSDIFITLFNMIFIICKDQTFSGFNSVSYTTTL